MKHAKKLLALVLTLTLAFGLALPAASALSLPTNTSGSNWLVDSWRTQNRRNAAENVATELVTAGMEAPRLRPWVIGGLITILVLCLAFIVWFVLTMAHII
ncbi:MAG: hypothetical protein FWD06_05135 [Oscillospiraceae bacterium]|nr:hypothetical protein [Oscillospiraceae bacterium]